MATLVLQTAGAAAGEFFGGPIGALVGRAIGGAVGGVIDARLLGSLGGDRRGPRLSTMNGVSSTEGAAVPRIYGRARVGGQLIWATRFLEVGRKTSASSGGKGGPKVTNYSYYANVAFGLCEGPAALVRRVWADGREIDITSYTTRFHPGDEMQATDPLIVAKEGAANAPAYRGLAYIVFEMLPLADFGNRIPQLTFEVVRPIAGLASMVRAVDIIPSAGEFAYAPAIVRSTAAPGVSAIENRHQLTRVTDWLASIDALQAICPNLQSVALVVAWFGDDLRAAHCTIAPRVETPAKNVIGGDWSVAGLSRSGARVVSQIDGRPATGGTPSDANVVAALRDLRKRGLSVTFYPFVMMDIAADNRLPDPSSGAASQPAYPWRGRITCDPAPDAAGSPDATSAAEAQVAAFFGSQNPSGAEWSLRRFVLHCADLCAQAGGVDGFLVGSELVGLTRVRSAPGVYPAATRLASLAADVKARLGAATKVSYAADWTEYGAHVLDGGAQVRFPLDVVWGSPAVDFIGVDAYWPLSDWRDGFDHQDAAVARSVHDRDYLQARVASGEAFDWFYANDADRLAQRRTPITDGAFGKPWIFRQKDLVGWWSNPHVERTGGVELAAPTAWSPQSKPIWLTEIGCPAIDRGANAPNVFPDPKSAQSALPPFSRGGRDDLMQVRALEASLAHFDPAQPGSNPVSAVYGGPMVDPARIHIWAWDARPFPAFPLLSGVWTDAANWATGHWINGRIEGVGVDRLVSALAREIPDGPLVAATPLVDGFLDGYALDHVVSPRAAIEPLAALFGFDAHVSDGVVAFADRTARAVVTLGDDDLVADKDGALVRLARAQDTDLPHEIAVTFSDGASDYRTARALSRRLQGFSHRVSEAEVACVTHAAEAQRLADKWLQDLWAARETAAFELRPGLAALDVGDAVAFAALGPNRLFRITRIICGLTRTLEARAIEPNVYDHGASTLAPSATIIAKPAFVGPPQVLVLDLAVADDAPTLQYIAAFADPWPGAVAVWRTLGGATYTLAGTITRPALVALSTTDFPAGPRGRIDHAASLTIVASSGALQSIADLDMFAGGNRMAIQGADGAWEIFSFGLAELIAPAAYRLSRLQRGLGGEDALAGRVVAAGATVVLLDDAVVPLASGVSTLSAAYAYRVGPASLDYSNEAYVDVAAHVTGKALMPLAPVEPRAARSSAGVTISFMRRGRIDADAWAPVEIPLGEDIEAYAIDILAGGTVKRTLAVSSPSALYAGVDELADFGAPQTMLALRITQLSAAVGRGFPLAASVPVV